MSDSKTDSEGLNLSYESIPEEDLLREEKEDSLLKQPFSPSSPLLRKSYLEIKVSCKNLQNIFLSEEELQNGKNNQEIQLNPYYMIYLNPSVELNEDNVCITKTDSIFHNSPKWTKSTEIDISQFNEKILIEVYSNKVYINKQNNGFRNNILDESTQYFLGFQLIPIEYIISSNKFEQNLNLQLIHKKYTEYFDKEYTSVMSIENHNLPSYISPPEKENYPSINIKFIYKDESSLLTLQCSVHSLINREDIQTGKKCLVYKLFISRGDGAEWFKESTFEEIEEFRKKIGVYDKEIFNLNFPSKSMFSSIPFLGSLFFEDVDDNESKVQIKIKEIENFFDRVTKNLSLYHIDLFVQFFSEQIKIERDNRSFKKSFDNNFNTSKNHVNDLRANSFKISHKNPYKSSFRKETFDLPSNPLKEESDFNSKGNNNDEDYFNEN